MQMGEASLFAEETIQRIIIALSAVVNYLDPTYDGWDYEF